MFLYESMDEEKKQVHLNLSKLHTDTESVQSIFVDMDTPETQLSTDELVANLRKSPGFANGVRDLRKINLANQDLSGVNLSGLDLSRADLQGANLSHARLFKTILRGANLSRANLESSELTGADLSEANLEEANLVRAGLGMTVLKKALLFKTNLAFATLTKSNLEEADLRCANLESARIREANLEKADLTNAVLHRADISCCEVHKASFTDADLRDANLSGLTDFSTANWVGADMRGVNFSGAYLLRRFAMDQNYIKEFRESSPSASFIYYIWWFTSDCGRSIGRWLALIGVLALIFAGLYTQVELSFGMHEDSWFMPLYFSIVTMTTLGYGDVLPASTTAQIVSTVQVLISYIMLGGLLSIFSNKLARRAE